MDVYGKIFKRYLDNNLDVMYREYNPDSPDGKYYLLIEEALKNKEQQVIINSEIMLDIVYSVVEDGGIILEIKMSDNTDQEVIDNIKRILQKMQKNSLYYTDLKELLEWANTTDSINISLLDLYYKDVRYQLNVEGLFWNIKNNNDLQEFFHGIIKKSVERVIL